MPAFVTTPRTVFGAHKITTEEILEDISTHHHDHPRLPTIVRVMENCGVRTRYFTRPLDAPTVSGTADVQERAQVAFDDALAMAERAALLALDAAGLTADDIDAIVTTHATGWSVPNLDVHLVAQLGLRPTVRRIPLTSVACAGGAQALIRAADLVAAHPGERVLVVAAETISTTYNHSSTSIDSMIYKALFADAAAAAVVTDAPIGPGLVIDETFEYVLPHSLDRYRGRLDSMGVHFNSTQEAPTTAASTLGTLVEWLGPRQADFAVVHPGSLRIIADTTAALGLGAEDTAHSVQSLTNEGNLGGVSILRVLELTHTTPPADDAYGTAIAFGPGFIVAALRCRWLA